MRAYLVSFLGELADRLAPPTKWPDRMAIVRETRLRLQIRRQQRLLSPPSRGLFLHDLRGAPLSRAGKRRCLPHKVYLANVAEFIKNCAIFVGVWSDDRKYRDIFIYLFSLLMFYVILSLTRRCDSIWLFWNCRQALHLCTVGFSNATINPLLVFKSELRRS